MIKTVIFDMDGILTDSEVVNCRTYQEQAKKYGKDFTVDMYKVMLGEKLEEDIAMFRTYYGQDFPAEEVVYAAQEKAREILTTNAPRKKGALELLKYLKDNNYKTIVATSTIKEVAVKMLKSCGLYEYFDDGIYGDDVMNGKPDPEVFNKAASKMHSLKEECLVIEDSEKGIEAAYNANIKVICVPDMKYPEQKYQNMTYKIVDSLFDVMDLLNH